MINTLQNEIAELGLTDELSEQIKDLDLSEFSVGRVTQEHRERYIVSYGETEYPVEITGNLIFSAGTRADFPAVGDRVIIKIYDPGQAIIHNILSRKSVLARQAVGKPGETQIISANIDVAFIVQSVGNESGVQ